MSFGNLLTRSFFQTSCFSFCSFFAPSLKDYLNYFSNRFTSNADLKPLLIATKSDVEGSETASHLMWTLYNQVNVYLHFPTSGLFSDFETLVLVLTAPFPPEQFHCCPCDISLPTVVLPLHSSPLSCWPLLILITNTRWLKGDHSSPCSNSPKPMWCQGLVS